MRKLRLYMLEKTDMFTKKFNDRDKILLERS